MPIGGSDQDVALQQIQPLQGASVSLSLFSTGVFDENPPHSLGRGGKKVASIVPPVAVFRTNQQRARWAGVSRSDIGRATRRAYDGFPVGQYRQADKMYPILLRHVERERDQFAGAMEALQVHPSFSTHTVPLAQVTRETSLRWDTPLIWRYDRRRTITVQAVPHDGVPASVVREAVAGPVDAIQLPRGYEIEWGGEFESSRHSQQSLVPGVVPAVESS